MELTNDMITVIKWWIQGDDYCPKSCPMFNDCSLTENKICIQINDLLTKEKNILMKKKLISRITSDKDILNGIPIIKGTKIPVKAILDFISYGMSKEEIKQTLPSINNEDIEAAILYDKKENLLKSKKNINL